MIEPTPEFRSKRIPLHHGAGHIPVLGFGTLIPGAEATITATKARWRPDSDTSIVPNDIAMSFEVGEALRAALDSARHCTGRPICNHEIVEHESST